MMNKKNYVLNNGLEIPKIGYGTWKLKNNDDTVCAVSEAIKIGYRLFDTASAYNNEKTIGLGFKKSKIDRNNLFITGKLWNDSRKYDDVINACKKTIDELDCEFLDLYLIHWPASPALYENWEELNWETWTALEKLYNDGFVKAIGVCNFKVHQLESLLKKAIIKPMVNQIEFHIGQMQSEIVNYCKNNDILVEAWSPLGSGKMLKNAFLQNMATKYSVTVAQLCIRWCVQNDVLPIPRSKNIDRINSNFDVFDFEISDSDMKTLNEMPYIGGSGLDSDTLTLFG